MGSESRSSSSSFTRDWIARSSAVSSSSASANSASSPAPPCVARSSTAGAGSLTLPIPNVTGLIGVKFYNQYIALDAPANTLGLTFTNGGAGKIGG